MNKYWWFAAVCYAVRWSLLKDGMCNVLDPLIVAWLSFSWNLEADLVSRCESGSDPFPRIRDLRTVSHFSNSKNSSPESFLLTTFQNCEGFNLIFSVKIHMILFIREVVNLRVKIYFWRENSKYQNWVLKHFFLLRKSATIKSCISGQKTWILPQCAKVFGKE